MAPQRATSAAQVVTLPVYHPPSAAQVAIRADFDSYLASDTFSVQVRVRVWVGVRVRVRVEFRVRVRVWVRARVRVCGSFTAAASRNYQRRRFPLQVTRVPTLQGPLNALVPPSYDAAALAALPVPTAHQQWWALMSG